MATLKRTNSKPLKDTQPPPPPPRECVACCEPEGGDTLLIRPCRDCDTDYCYGCLLGMFTDAIDDKTRMPPRCCTFLQIHTIVNDITPEALHNYRDKFEEWISPVKTYCPAPTCSTFISERRLPKPPTDQSKRTSSLPEFLHEILTAVQDSSSARFFRGEMDITQLPGYNTVVERPIDLSKIQANIARYDSVGSLTLDMQLLVSNACTYNGSGHPVSKAAEALFKHYLRAMSTATQRVLDRPIETVKDTPTFPCPKCHVAICTTCKQIEHGDTPCDTTASDQELAMLESFGYKRCPRCKAGVKKMFGCSHMQCLCGAHWCYWCLSSIDECDGGCSGREDEEDEEDYYSEEEVELEREAERQAAHEAARQDGIEAPARTAQAAPVGNPDAPANLDAGGYGRWAERNLDFGEEPEEDDRTQVWSCKHRFSPYRIDKDDQFDRGDYLSMECNRCFAKVVPRKPSMSARTLKLRIGASCKQSSYGKWVRSLTLEKGGNKVAEGQDDQAFECAGCRVVTCEACRKKYEEEVGGDV